MVVSTGTKTDTHTHRFIVKMKACFSNRYSEKHKLRILRICNSDTYPYTDTHTHTYPPTLSHTHTQHIEIEVSAAVPSTVGRLATVPARVRHLGGYDLEKAAV